MCRDVVTLLTSVSAFHTPSHTHTPEASAVWVDLQEEQQAAGGRGGTSSSSTSGTGGIRRGHATAAEGQQSVIAVWAGAFVDRV